MCVFMYVRACVCVCVCVRACVRVFTCIPVVPCMSQGGFDRMGPVDLLLLEPDSATSCSMCSAAGESKGT